jgi:hypothetical protein
MKSHQMHGRTPHHRKTPELVSTVLVGLLFGLLLSGCTHMATDQSPPTLLSTVANKVYYDTQAVLGACPPDVEAGAAPIIAKAIVAEGINRIGTALTAAADAQSEAILSQRNIEVKTDKGIGSCLMIARAWFYREFPLATAQNLMPISSPEGWSFGLNDYAPMWDAGLFLAGRPDFFFAGRIVRSTDQSKYSVRPSLAFLALPMNRNGIRTDVRYVTVALAIGEARTDMSTAPGTTMTLGKLTPDKMVRFPKINCAASGVSGNQRDCNQAGDLVIYQPYLSEWFTVTATTTRKPMLLQTLVTETREASQYLKFVATIFNEPTVKTALTSAAQAGLISSVRREAAEVKFSADNKLENEAIDKLSTAKDALDLCTADPTSTSARMTARKALGEFFVALSTAKRMVFTPAQRVATLNKIRITNGGSSDCSLASADLLIVTGAAGL